MSLSCRVKSSVESMERIPSVELTVTWEDREHCLTRLLVLLGHAEETHLIVDDEKAGVKDKSTDDEE